MIEEEREKQLRFAVLYLRRGEIKKALATCEKILAEDPNNPLALEIMGDIKSMRGELKEALALYKKALEIDPTLGEVEKKVARTALRLAEEEGKFEISIKVSPIKKYPYMAFLLSFVCPGLGQIYNEDFLKGAIGIILFIVAYLILQFSRNWMLFAVLWMLLALFFAGEGWYKANKMMKEIKQKESEPLPKQ